ncbi:hypothetical protein HPB47_013086 [Ixodes persulcatus]|uniref:Uncharacterized protein n=1 Tax=Ixodes persulcatus TaxID=34615 RepID=A0AC60NRQ4_IXOPE|nr:hypothetical protein HPB47_013086 [Ixodes persulcatus]
MEGLFGEQPTSIIASSSSVAVVEEVVESKTDVRIQQVLNEYQQMFTNVSGCTSLAERRMGNKKEHAFASLKQMLAHGAVVSLPDLNQPFVVETDTSCVGIADGLQQVSISRVLTDSKSNLPRPRMGGFNCMIRRRRGRENILPDALSRAPLYLTETAASSLPKTLFPFAAPDGDPRITFEAAATALLIDAVGELRDKGKLAGSAGTTLNQHQYTVVIDSFHAPGSTERKWLPQRMLIAPSKTIKDSSIAAIVAVGGEAL